VPLSAPAREAPLRQHVKQAEDRLRAGALYVADPAEPVFTDEIGRRYSPKAASHAFRRIARKARITTTRLHAAGRTAASNLVGSGVDATTAASLLGNDPNVLLGRSAHVLAGKQQAAMDALADG
jgi:integrase